MNWPEAAVAIVQTVGAGLAAVLGTAVAYWFGQRKDRKQHRVERLRSEQQVIADELNSQRQIYLEFRRSLADVGAAMAGPAGREEQCSEVRQAFARLQLAYASLELQSSKPVADAAKSAHAELSQWVDVILGEGLDIGIPSNQIDLETAKLTAAMKAHLGKYEEDISKIKLKINEL